jgi:hypothetical protein
VGVGVKPVSSTAYHNKKWLFLNNIKLEKNAVLVFRHSVDLVPNMIAKMSNKCNCEVPYGRFKQLVCKFSECKFCRY